jgi:DNA-directed RNA polymerase specialized sigma24 family protein
MKVGADNNTDPDLEQYRSYLKLLADLQLNPQLKVKEGASDIVQQTMLEAHRDLGGFRGKSDAELRAWLKTILTHNLLSVARHYRRDKRAAEREVSLQDQLEQSSALAASSTGCGPDFSQHEADEAGTSGTTGLMLC